MALLFSIRGSFKLVASLPVGRKAYGTYGKSSKSAKLLRDVVEEMRTSNKYLGSIQRDAERQRTEFSKLAQKLGLQGSCDAGVSSENSKGDYGEIVAKGERLKDSDTSGIRKYSGEAERYSRYINSGGRGSTQKFKSKSSGAGNFDVSPRKLVERSDNENSERTDDEDSEGTDDEDSEGTDDEHSKGTDDEHSEGTDDGHSEGTDDEDSDGTDDEYSEETDDGDSEGTDESDEDSERSDGEYSEGTDDENVTVRKRHGQFVAAVHKYLENRGALLKRLTGCKVGTAGDFDFKYRNLEPVVDKTSWSNKPVHLIFLKESGVAIVQVEDRRVTRETIAQLQGIGRITEKRLKNSSSTPYDSYEDPFTELFIGCVHFDEDVKNFALACGVNVVERRRDTFHIVENLV